MRHDLGCLVRDELAARAAGVASLTNESLLWSSLPTITHRQLETLARGIDALRAPAAVEDTTESLRGRSADPLIPPTVPFRGGRVGRVVCRSDRARQLH